MGFQGVRLARAIARALENKTFLGGEGASNGAHRRSLRLRRVSPVDERGRKGAKLGKRINRSWVGKGAAKLGGHCWNLRKTRNNADARAQRSERELTVHGWEGGPQDSAAATSDANGDLE